MIYLQVQWLLLTIEMTRTTYVKELFLLSIVKEKKNNCAVPMENLWAPGRSWTKATFKTMVIASKVFFRLHKILPMTLSLVLNFYHKFILFRSMNQVFIPRFLAIKSLSIFFRLLSKVKFRFYKILRFTNWSIFYN